jgi:hypothetical protein
MIIKLSRTARMRHLACLLAVGLTGPASAAIDADDAGPASVKPAQTKPAQTKPTPSNNAKTPSKTAAPETDGADTSKTGRETSPTGETQVSVEELRKAWMATRKQMFAGKHQVIADSEDTETVNHLNWYEATGFTRPYPGETTVRPPTDFPNRFKERREDKDD